MSLTTDLRTAAKMEYQERAKERLKNAPIPLEVLMRSPEPITQTQLDALNGGYIGRDRIPEPLLSYADLYHELTGQECTKRVFTDWLATFWEWKDEKLSLDDIRAAWAESKHLSFIVGRPGALTVTAVGCKSKAKSAVTGTSKQVEETKKILDEREGWEDFKRSPIPEAERERMRQWKSRIQR